MAWRTRVRFGELTRLKAELATARAELAEAKGGVVVEELAQAQDDLADAMQVRLEIAFDIVSRRG